MDRSQGHCLNRNSRATKKKMEPQTGKALRVKCSGASSEAEQNLQLRRRNWRLPLPAGRTRASLALSCDRASPDWQHERRGGQPRLTRS